MFRSGKTYLTWMQTREWCLKNPDKCAAIATPNGVFEVKFVPRKIDSDCEPTGQETDWIKKRFIEP